MSCTSALAEFSDIQVIGDRALIARGIHQTTATIITSKEIQQSGKSSIVELLQGMPGLYVEQTNGLTTNGNISVRGADPNFTLVLIDGVRVNNPTNSRGGSYNFSSIDLSTVERIEILKGPQSFAYGSSALAGVINIVTTTEKNDTFEQHIENGNRGWISSSTSVVKNFDTNNISISTNYLDSGEPQNKSDEIRHGVNTHLIHKINNTDSFTIRSRYSKQQKDFFPEDSGGINLAELPQQQHQVEREWLTSFNYKKDFKSSTKLNFNLSHYENKIDDDSPGIAPGTRDPFGIPASKSDVSYRSTQLVAGVTTLPNSQSAINLGFEGNFEHGSERGILTIAGTNIDNRYKLDRDTYAFFAQGLFSLNDTMDFESAARIDSPEKHSTRFSPQLAINFFLRQLNTSARVEASSAFKVPSFFALGNNIVGNTSLKPETSMNYGINTSTDLLKQKILFKTSAYISKYENLIDFFAGPPPQLINRSKVDIYGGEVSLEYIQDSRFNLKTNLSYSKNDIKNSSENLLKRPKWQAGIQAYWQPMQNLSFTLDTRYIGKIRDSSLPTGEVKLDDYTRVDAVATWNIHPKANVRAAVDNLFNENYQLAVGVPADGITPRVNLSVVF